jgi:thioredoxin-dependent peroxiredoxin
MRTKWLVSALAVAALTLGARAEDPKMPKEGEAAPAVSLPATQIAKVLPEKKDATTLSLADFKGKKNVVLFFYPKALTRGCTIESCGFRDVIDQFGALDTVVVGISVDTLEKQDEFTKKEGLTFPLLADAEAKGAKTFGVLDTSKGIAKRVTFVIDKQGVIRKVYPMVSVQSHPQEVLKYVKETLAAR